MSRVDMVWGKGILLGIIGLCLHAQTAATEKPQQQLDAFDRRRLMILLRILATRSFAPKAEIWCRDQVGRPGTLAMSFSGGRSGDEMEAYYNELLRSEPTTREGELDRQRRLQAVGELVASYEKNASECKMAVINGDTKMPTDKEMLAEIEMLRTGVLPPNTIKVVVHHQPDLNTSAAALQAPSTPANGDPLKETVHKLRRENATLVTKVEPEYTEEARRAKISGDVVVNFLIDEKGIPSDIRVTQSLEHGLDQKAVEAVAKWRFRPATENGVSVGQYAHTSVTFRTY